MNNKLRGNKNGLKHGHASPTNKSYTYKTWESMIQRCTNPNKSSYKNYGGRIPPITVCYRWSNKKNGFKNFLEDMGVRPLGLSLDRIDNDKGYYKENCRWATRKQQNRNSRWNRFEIFNDKRVCLAEWQDITGIRQETIKDRLDRGWSTEKTLTTITKKSKFVDIDILNMRKLYKKGLKINEISKKYNSNYKTTWKIVTYKTWKHLP